MDIDHGEQIGVLAKIGYPDHLDVHLQTFHRPCGDHLSVFDELASAAAPVYPVPELQKAFLLHYPVEFFMVDKIAVPFQVGGHQPIPAVYELVPQNILYGADHRILRYRPLGLVKGVRGRPVPLFPATWPPVITALHHTGHFYDLGLAAFVSCIGAVH